MTLYTTTEENGKIIVRELFSRKRITGIEEGIVLLTPASKEKELKQKSSNNKKEMSV